MSGIAALLHRDGRPVSEAVLGDILDAMPYYGPDGRATWSDGACGLGHLLTHDTPESLYERGPDTIATVPDVVLVADARLDNRDELCGVFGVPRPERATTPDSRLILHAYLHWGADCAEHLLGDFAFVVRDGRSDTLFCARDHMGIRPLYFFLDDHQLVCATDIKGVIAAPGVPRELDDDAVLRYRSECALPDRTLFRDVQKLRAGHTLQVTPRGVALRAYWQPGTGPEVRFASDDQYGERLAELLEEATRCRLRTVHRVGCHLSGGLDSSALTVLTARALLRADDRVPSCFSWSPAPLQDEDTSKDERSLVERVCAQEGLSCTYVELTARDVATTLRRDVSVDPSMTLYAEPVVRRMAKERGIGVLVSGWGGDEFISNFGEGHLPDLLVRGRWWTLLRALNAARLLRVRRIRSLFHRLALPLTPDSIYSLLGYDAPPRSHPELPPPPLDPRMVRYWKAEMRRARPRRGVRRNLARNYEWGGYTGRLESWASLGAQDGIAYRYPLLDRRIIDYCFAVPTDLFQRGRHFRYLFRLALKGVLPPDMQWGTKNSDRAKLERLFPVLAEGRQLLFQEIERGEVRLQGVPFVRDEWVRQAKKPHSGV